MGRSVATTSMSGMYSAVLAHCLNATQTDDTGSTGDGLHINVIDVATGDATDGAGRLTEPSDMLREISRPEFVETWVYVVFGLCLSCVSLVSVSAYVSASVSGLYFSCLCLWFLVSGLLSLVSELCYCQCLCLCHWFSLGILSLCH